MNNVTQHSNKDDIITSSLELIDSQESQLATFKQQQKVLIYVLAVLVVFNALF